MGTPITVENLTISGFRAFLREQSINLRRNNKPLSMAIFAPNAKGKSSLVDGIEYFFSEDGTLDKLGKISRGNQAGREALRHVMAHQAGIEPSVRMTFSDGKSTFGDTRNVLSDYEKRPDSASKVVDVVRPNFIIRGHRIRRFVEDQSPQERFKEIAEWFGLSSLSSIQDNLRNLRLKTINEINDDSSLKERLRDLQRITGGELKEWDENRVVEWVNSTLLSPLDEELVLKQISPESGVYKEIKRRKVQEEESIGLTGLKRIRSNINMLYTIETDESGEKSYSGSLIELVEQKSDLDTRRIQKDKEQQKAKEAVFKPVWEAAKNIFDKTELDIEECPICKTPIEQTAIGNRDHIAVHLTEKLKELEAYNNALDQYTKSYEALKRKHTEVKSHIGLLESRLGDGDFAEEIQALKQNTDLIKELEYTKEFPDLDGIKIFLKRLNDDVNGAISNIEKEKGENTYIKVTETIDNLFELSSSLTRILEYKEHLEALYKDLVDIENICRPKIREYIQGIMDSLKDDVNKLYRQVHIEETEAPPIKLELPKDTKEAYLNLLIDFSDNREGVSPSGYLSDSQIRTLALSLRLAAIRLFNREFPVIVLDDVVTSYDAEHRKALASLLAKYFAGFQTIIVTHDERFFLLLKDHLDPSTWNFKRIMELRENFGPLFDDHKITDEMIQEKFRRGESAANDIRQAEEEWLLRICREFGVEVRIRGINNAYEYGRAELAESLYKFLKGLKIEVPRVEGINNPFLVTLMQGSVENFGSHFSDSRYSIGSLGDERKRWKEFVEFREYFSCPNCGRSRFKRPNPLKKPICRHKSCEHPFCFSINDEDG